MPTAPMPVLPAVTAGAAPSAPKPVLGGVASGSGSPTLFVRGALTVGGVAVTFPPLLEFYGEPSGRPSYTRTQGNLTPPTEYIVGWDPFRNLWFLTSTGIMSPNKWTSTDDVPNPSMVTTWVPEGTALGVPSLQLVTARADGPTAPPPVLPVFSGGGAVPPQLPLAVLGGVATNAPPLAPKPVLPPPTKPQLPLLNTDGTPLLNTDGSPLFS